MQAFDPQTDTQVYQTMHYQYVWAGAQQVHSPALCALVAAAECG
jgi:hypothetical protein